MRTFIPVKTLGPAGATAYEDFNVSWASAKRTTIQAVFGETFSHNVASAQERDIGGCAFQRAFKLDSFGDYVQQLMPAVSPSF